MKRYSFKKERITKEITFPLISIGPIEDLQGNKRTGFEASFSINRK